VFALILIVIVLALIWVLFIMPQRRRASAQTKLLERLEVGDEVLTIGGMYGAVRELDGDDALIEVAPGTSIRMARRAIATIVEPDEDEPDDEPGDEPLSLLDDSESEDVKRR
jgi:preprotein translocase subunit YajC